MNHTKKRKTSIKLNFFQTYISYRRKFTQVKNESNLWDGTLWAAVAIVIRHLPNRGEMNGWFSIQKKYKKIMKRKT